MSALDNDKPILIGFIIDVSSSMKRNWKNQDADKSTRIQIIRNVLNDQIKKLAILHSNSDRGNQTKIFALGMGFKRKMYWSDIEIKYGREKDIDTPLTPRINAGVVCDILALAEIVPTTDEFKNLGKLINSKWNTYVTDFIEISNIREDADEKLKHYLTLSLNENPLNKLKNGFISRCSKSIEGLAKKYSLFNSPANWLKELLVLREAFIQNQSKKTINSFFKSIIEKSKEMFDLEEDEFRTFIENTIEGYVEEQCNDISYLVALGHPIERIVSSFDEKTIKELGQIVYKHLSQKIEGNIKIAWQINRATLLATATILGVKLDQKILRELTEKCIQKYSWNTLSRFVENTIKDVFVKTFEKIAKDSLSNWIGLASSREVVRSLKEIVNVLPDTLDETFYSNEIMFGSTPIYDAINLASLRFLDKKYSEYQKILIIISDGEFNSTKSIRPSIELQKAGIIIISCYIRERNTLLELVSKPKSKWPKGAKMLFDMASRHDEKNIVSRSIIKYGYKVKDDVKLFIQINHSSILEEIINSVVSIHK